MTLMATLDIKILVTFSYLKRFLNNFNFEKKKQYTFKIVHGMREYSLNGIETIGLNIKSK